MRLRPPLLKFHAAALSFLPCYLLLMYNADQLLPLTAGRIILLVLFYLLVLIPLYLYLCRSTTAK